MLTPCLPGIVQCQIMRLTVPSANVSGLATKPYGTKSEHRSGGSSPAARHVKGIKKKRGEALRSRGTDVWVVLPPRLPLLREAAARDSPRHGCGGGGVSSFLRRWGFGWGGVAQVKKRGGPVAHFNSALRAHLSATVGPTTCHHTAGWGPQKARGRGGRSLPSRVRLGAPGPLGSDTASCF